jgi:hypothetical protein
VQHVSWILGSVATVLSENKCIELDGMS